VRRWSFGGQVGTVVISCYCLIGDNGGGGPSVVQVGTVVISCYCLMGDNGGREHSKFSDDVKSSIMANSIREVASFLMRLRRCGSSLALHGSARLHGYIQRWG